VTIGEQMRVDDHYELRFDGLAIQEARDGRIIDRAYVTVIRDGEEVAPLEPRIDRFPQVDGTVMPMSIAGAHSTLRNDFYVLLGGAGEGVIDYEAATFTIYINPLINLVWLGGIVLIFGTVISAWPNEKQVVPVRERAYAGAGLQAAT
jgi:cytochrome c-type biogenesis protein CcmF